MESNIRKQERKGSFGIRKFPAPREPRAFQRNSSKFETEIDIEQLDEGVEVMKRAPSQESMTSFRPRQISKVDRNEINRSSRIEIDSDNEDHSVDRKSTWAKHGPETGQFNNKENTANSARAPRQGWDEAKTSVKPIDAPAVKPVPRIAEINIDDNDEEEVIEIDILQRHHSTVDDLPSQETLGTPQKVQKKKKISRKPSGLLISTKAETPDPMSGIQRKSGRYDHEDDSPKVEIVKDWEKLFSGEVVTQGLVKPVIPFVMRAHPRGQFTTLVQCNIVRSRSSASSQMFPTYELYLQEPRRLLCVAMKMSLNRTSNYHLFDMTRGQLGTKLTKKSGNYLGKLRAHNSLRTSYSLISNSSEKEEIAGIVFDKLNTIDFLKDGSQPRKMHVVVPHVDFNKVPIPNKMKENDENLLSSIIEKGVFTNRAMCFQTKEPVLENGNYRLNFQGRVTKPSVKNFQLVSIDNTDNIVCQFGKTGDDQFNLDFKTPLCALQAFSFALCQFNL